MLHVIRGIRFICPDQWVILKFRFQDEMKMSEWVAVTGTRRRQWNHTRVLCVTAKLWCFCHKEVWCVHEPKPCCNNPKYSACTTMLPLSNTSLTGSHCCYCTPASFFSFLFLCTMALTEFQNKPTDGLKSECRFWNTPRLNDFLTLMLHEVSAGELSHGALVLSLSPFSLQLNILSAAPGCRRSPECYLLLCVNPISHRICGKQAQTQSQHVPVSKKLLITFCAEIHQNQKMMIIWPVGRKKNTLKHFLNVFLFGAHRITFQILAFFYFLIFYLWPPYLSHMPTLIALDLILSLLLSLFYHPSLQLSFISLFLFFHSSTPSLFPRAHIFIEPSRPWTSAHCNNAIRQGDCVAFKVCVCEKVWNIVFTKQTVWPTVIHRPCLNV